MVTGVRERGDPGKVEGEGERMELDVLICLQAPSRAAAPPGLREKLWYLVRVLQTRYILLQAHAVLS